MLSQKFARLYPNVEVGYKIIANTVATAAYLGKVQFHTLSSLVELNPYLSATSTVRQSDIPLDLNLALETDWSEIWRTRFSARFQSVRDYPLLTEGGLGVTTALSGAPGHKGMWTTEYLGTTSVSTYQADMFAKFGANSYFTLSLEINSSKNSKTQWQIPYLPELRLGVGALLEVLRGLTVHPTLAYVGLRVPDLYEATKLKEYVVLGIRGQYAALRSLDVFVELQNLSDSKYDEWNGYRALPFVITAGIGIRW
jgi:outer membrane receptor protein involved in Fe transport